MRVQIILFILFAITLHPALTAPKSRNKNLPQTVFDQKQTGDYNIQVHLKDFQIIALLSDDALGGLGDYDYNYDYSDFTIKPNNSTQKPTEASASSQPPSPSSTSSPSEPPQSTSSSFEGSASISTNKNPETSTNAAVISTLQQSTNSPDKIKVQIIESGAETPGIVPNDEMTHDIPALGEILHYRRCASGYSRDKKGRCRRVRRPSGGSFDISRLASNFAARFRSQASLADSDNASSDSASSESVSVESSEE